MKTKPLKSCARQYGIILFLFFAIPANYAQEPLDSLNIYHISTTDGNEYSGNIIRKDSSVIVVKTAEIDSLVIRRKYIKNMERIDRKRYINGKLWMENPQAARYMWAPNGYGLKKGEAYYQNIWVLFNQLSVGVTNYFSVGFGTIPTFLFGADFVPVWLTPKFSFPVIENKLNIGAGAMITSLLGDNEGTAGLAYGIITAGSRDKNFSLGLGYSYSGSNGWSDVPTINLSGMIRVSPRTYLITENYLMVLSGDNLVLIMLGGRSFVKRVSIDYGLILPSIQDSGISFVIPWLGITIPFGNVNKPVKE